MNKITQLYVVINDDVATNEEGIVAGFNMLPLVASRERTLSLIREMARTAADMGAKNVRLVKFTQIEEVERF